MSLSREPNWVPPSPEGNVSAEDGAVKQIADIVADAEAKIMRRMEGWTSEGSIMHQLASGLGTSTDCLKLKSTVEDLKGRMSSLADENHRLRSRLRDELTRPEESRTARVDKGPVDRGSAAARPCGQRGVYLAVVCSAGPLSCSSGRTDQEDGGAFSCDECGGVLVAREGPPKNGARAELLVTPPVTPPAPLPAPPTAPRRCLTPRGLTALTPGGTETGLKEGRVMSDMSVWSETRSLLFFFVVSG
eukprot:g29903.t1